MRYLTFWSLKMDKSSLKSLNIRRRFLRLVSRKGYIRNGVHPFVDGQLLPVPVFILLHGIKACKRADRLVHMFVCSTLRATSLAVRRTTFKTTCYNRGKSTCEVACVWHRTQTSPAAIL